MRVARAVTGALLVIVSYPLVLGGGALWFAERHRGTDGTYAARTETVHADGYALVVDDIDALLRADAPYARGGDTRLSVSATGPGGPLFIGLAPAGAVRRYLAGSAYTRIDRVRPARGALPVDVTTVAGPETPTGLPFGQPFWISTSTGLTRDGVVEDALRWTPSAVRGQHLSLVIMNADASMDLDVRVAVSLRPNWLVPAIWGLLVFGGTLLLLAVVLLAWPAPARACGCAAGSGERTGAGPDPASGKRSVARVRRRPGGRSAAYSDDKPTAPALPAVLGAAGSDPTRALRQAERPVGTDAVDMAMTGGTRDGAPRGGTGTRDGALRINGACAPGRGGTRAGAAARSGGTRDAEPPTWSALLASARPPATPRLMWPPKRVERPTAATEPEDVAAAAVESEPAGEPQSVTARDGAVLEAATARDGAVLEVATAFVVSGGAAMPESPAVVDAATESVATESVATDDTVATDGAVAEPAVALTAGLDGVSISDESEPTAG